MDDLFTFIGFLISVCFYIWFGTTLNSIKRNLETLTRKSQAQIELSAVIAYTLSPPDGRTMEERLRAFQDAHAQLRAEEGTQVGS